MYLAELLCVYVRQCWGKGFVGWEVHFDGSFLQGWASISPSPISPSFLHPLLLSAAFLFCSESSFQLLSPSFPFVTCLATSPPCPMALCHRGPQVLLQGSGGSGLGQGSGSGRCLDAVGTAASGLPRGGYRKCCPLPFSWLWLCHLTPPQGGGRLLLLQAF